MIAIFLLLVPLLSFLSLQVFLKFIVSVLVLLMLKVFFSQIGVFLPPLNIFLFTILSLFLLVSFSNVKLFLSLVILVCFLVLFSLLFLFFVLLFGKVFLCLFFPPTCLHYLMLLSLISLVYLHFLIVLPNDAMILSSFSLIMIMFAFLTIFIVFLKVTNSNEIFLLFIQNQDEPVAIIILLILLVINLCLLNKWFVLVVNTFKKFLSLSIILFIDNLVWFIFLKMVMVLNVTNFKNVKQFVHF
mmetsp:Transcript_3095/g.4525  ORF Transcript_3095/g.4525 Transcript_3095/m.4525 type:complete len:243 (-) Transcript_3095:111-839(-)